MYGFYSQSMLDNSRNCDFLYLFFTVKPYVDFNRSVGTKTNNLAHVGRFSTDRCITFSFRFDGWSGVKGWKFGLFGWGVPVRVVQEPGFSRLGSANMNQRWKMFFIIFDQ